MQISPSMCESGGLGLSVQFRKMTPRLEKSWDSVDAAAGVDLSLPQ